MRPTSASVWSPQLKKYVCEDTKEGRIAIKAHPHQTQPVPPPINRTFKFVFLWSFGGTLFFVALCIGLSLAAGREPPPLFEKIIIATFDLAKIGFGAKGRCPLNSLRSSSSQAEGMPERARSWELCPSDTLGKEDDHAAPPRNRRSGQPRA
jgi:hypothetical protein